MTIQQFLARFDKVKAAAGQSLVCCPAHADKTPSLAVKESPDGSILLKCHAGCDVDQILAAMNLEPSDLFPDKEPSQKKTVQAEYLYQDEDGTILYKKIRYTPKGFSQCRPDGANWIFNLQGVRRVVYRLTELLGQPAAIFVEGEKDVDRAWAIGIPATCNPDGAGKWDRSFAEQILKQGVKRVAVIPDNDSVGIAHAQVVAAGLQAVGIEVRFVPLPGVPDHGDLSDYLEAGHTRDELLMLIRSAAIADVVTTIPKADVGPDRLFARLEDGRFRFSVRSAGVILEVGHLYRHRDGTLNGELLAKVNGQFPDAKTYKDGILSLGDFNFSSVSMRTTRAKLCADRSGDKGFDWYGALEEFVIEVVTHQSQGDPPVVLGDDLDFEDETRLETWDVEGLPILVSDPMVLFGDSACGKSFLALWVAGELANRGIKVLYVDWEFSEREHRKRLRRLFQPTPKNIHYIRSDVPMIREVARISRLVSDQKYQYLICDSIGFAVDGPAETHEAAKNYFGALRSCGVGSLSLAHIAKSRDDGKDATIYGSTFFRAGARSAWFVDRAAENPHGELNVGLHHRKANSSGLLKPLAYRLKFSNNRVFIERTDMAAVESLSSQLPLPERLRRIMQDGELYAYKDLAEDLGVTADSIRKIVVRSKKFFTRIGRKVKLAQLEEPPPPTDADNTGGKVTRHEF